jgi:hypothetical protein
MSYYTTDQPMPSIIIEHPIQNVGPEALTVRAEVIAAAVERFLS